MSEQTSSGQLSFKIGALPVACGCKFHPEGSKKYVAAGIKNLPAGTNITPNSIEIVKVSVQNIHAGKYITPTGAIILCTYQRMYRMFLHVNTLQPRDIETECPCM